jgi:hypothetical protein
MTVSVALPGFVPPLAAGGIAAPHPEHPRPIFCREPWVNLNGTWRFDFDPDDVGVQQRWFEPGAHGFGKRITVPFPWEATLSGIGDTEYRGVAWYAREVTIPSGEGWAGKDAWLVVGACDWEAVVWVNGQKAGEHVGGYTPFAVNLAPHAGPGDNVFVVIRARDVTNPQQPTGKQINWYTRTSGIWQTVYLEPRAAVHIGRFRFFCDVDANTAGGACPIRYEIEIAGDAKGLTTELYVGDEVVATGDTTIRATIPDAKLWTPDSPHLYDARLVLRDGERVVDEVHTYFGLRSVSVGRAPGRDYQYILLNGKPIYLRGALHQSFHPDGIYQYPDDAAVRSDYELCNRIGINFLRIHIKTPTPRELYWADKLGVLIMDDVPCYWKHTDQAKQWWQQTMEAAVTRDFNNPSIFSWCLFNETWGIGDGGYGADRHAWVKAMFERAKSLDPTRLIEDNSPCRYDHVVTDINSWHFYINDYAVARDHIREVVEKTFPGSTFNYASGFKQGNAPLMNSEYGGISAGLGDQDISWCFKYLTNELRKHDKICGYVYTELSDIEWEHNGFANYDRTPKEYGYDFWHPGFSLKDINSPDFVVLDAEPCVTYQKDEQRAIPVSISHWSDHRAGGLTLRWRTGWIDGLGMRHPGEWLQRAAMWKPYAVAPQEPIPLGAAPAEARRPLVGALLVELVDDDVVLARNYLNLRVPGRAPRFEVLGERTVALRFDPDEFAEWRWADGSLPSMIGIAREKAWAHGAGYVEYDVRVPDGVDLARVQSIRLLAEVSAKADDEKLAWPARRRPMDYPQTDVAKWPSDVRIAINGVVALERTLPDDPADARGVLSHVEQYQPGSYGWLETPELAGESVRRVCELARDGRVLKVRFEVPAGTKHPGGLAIFGDELGCYPVDPTILLVFESPHGLGADDRSDESVAVHRLETTPETLIATVDQGGATWRYTTERVHHWEDPDFDDSHWKEGKAGFGSGRPPNATINTPWNTEEIWLRKVIEIADPDSIVGATLRFHHDEDADIYINGERSVRGRRYTTDYAEVVLGREALSRLRPGRNVIAVRCRNKVGPQYFDLGLTVVRRAAKR